MRLKNTTDDKLAGAVRVFLALIFLMTGAMKLVVPELAEAWSGQLIAAELPFYTLTKWTVPFVEIGLGLTLALGLYSRIAALVVIAMTVVATYVHVVVDDPSLFPLQPPQPVIPLMLIAMAVFLIWRGGGAWSRDLREGSSEER